MRGKLLFITGGLIGYVLGARAGRKRYEQIAAAASDLWSAKPVQRQTDTSTQKKQNTPSERSHTTLLVSSNRVTLFLSLILLLVMSQQQESRLSEVEWQMRRFAHGLFYFLCFRFRQD